MKYTKNCFLPWTYMLIHGGGLMQTCPCPSDIQIGDFIIDYLEKNNPNEDIFNGEPLRLIRHGLLSGNLREMCRQCAYNSEELISTEEFQNRLIELLEQNKPGYRYREGDDLTGIYAYQTIGIGFSNKCNLRCLYCNQSTCADTNPFYKAEFSDEQVEKTLDFLKKHPIKQMIPAVEGEITLYRNWYRVYTRILQEHPQVELLLTTNLNRTYTEEEIELLARHKKLDISCDSLHPEVYSSIRVNGRLELLLDNLMRIKKKKEELHSDTVITIHIVVCNLTWEYLDEVSEFAFSHGFGLNIGNYEERANARGYREHILQPISQMSEEVKRQVAEKLERIHHRAEELGLTRNGGFICHGDILGRITKQLERNYNRVSFTDNPIYQAFLRKYPLGRENMHIDIVYDKDNFAYTGILLRKGHPRLLLDGVEHVERIVRRVVRLRPGIRALSTISSSDLAQPGFRSILPIADGIIEIDDRNEKFGDETDTILLEMEPLETHL